MSNDLQIHLRVFDHGKQGVLDGPDKIALQFKDKLGRTVRSTKPIPVSEFVEKSRQEFKEAFPGFHMNGFMGVDELVGIKLALYATRGQGLVSCLRRTDARIDPECTSDDSLPEKGIRIYVGWHTKADSHKPFSLDLGAFAFSDTKNSMKFEVETLDNGNYRAAYIAPLDDGKESNDLSPYAHLIVVWDSKKMGKLISKERVTVTPIDNNGKANDGRKYMIDTYKYDLATGALISTERIVTDKLPDRFKKNP